MKKRRSCLKWKMVQGVRVFCRLPYGHPRDQPCTPQAQLRLLEKRAELSKLAIEHEDSACDLCAGFVAATGRGADPEKAITMRCEWGQSLQQAYEDVIRSMVASS